MLMPAPEWTERPSILGLNRQHPGPRHCHFSPSSHHSLPTALGLRWPVRGSHCSPGNAQVVSLHGLSPAGPSGSPAPFLPSFSSSNKAVQLMIWRASAWECLCPAFPRPPPPAPWVTRPPQRKCYHCQGAPRHPHRPHPHSLQSSPVPSSL